MQGGRVGCFVSKTIFNVTYRRRHFVIRSLYYWNMLCNVGIVLYPCEVCLEEEQVLGVVHLVGGQG